MEEVKEYIHEELRSLKAFLEAIHVINEISPRSRTSSSEPEKGFQHDCFRVLKSYGIDSAYTDLSQSVDENASANHLDFIWNVKSLSEANA